MESLIGYGSDDDNDDVSYSKKQSSSQDDANYEEVQMDLSEESNDSPKLESRRDSKHSDVKSKDPERGKRRSSPHSSPRNTPPRRDDRYRDKDRDRGRYEKEKEDKRDDRREYKKDRYREDRKKEDRRDRKSDREKERNYDSRDNRDDRRSHRGSSRERHRSRSPKRSDYRSKRSSSRERAHPYPKRYDRASSKMDRLEKLGIELNASGSGYGGSSTSNGDRDDNKDRFYMPGITGRFTEQIQRRKLLWQKKEQKEEAVAIPTQSSKIWQNTTFAQDNDGKVANKFKRLMGIRGKEEEANKYGTDSLKKQEEMFTSMEAQYEVARTATHTMRGVGLGFGSFQR